MILMDLIPNQARVIGCLIEKEITTPDQYPLSLNSLTNACNQKSNREPVLTLSESEVQDVLDELRDKRLIREETGFGSRVVKYKHRFCNTEFSDLKLDAQELAVICVLLLRGPQTPGELRTRTNRLCEFSDVHQVEAVLNNLSQREVSLVVRLPREAGKRESRYAHLFCGEVEVVEPEVQVNEFVKPTDRIIELENRVAELERIVSEILHQ
ncbi:YceH family protein [Neptuniibacter sp.]|uniref:YceH family protein n=1 Tax=Neptuniibacter sp. TaxID=1962643 RepID=UPI003B591F66